MMQRIHPNVQDRPAALGGSSSQWIRGQKTKPNLAETCVPHLAKITSYGGLAEEGMNRHP